MHSRLLCLVMSACVTVCVVGVLQAQDGRVFRSTPETVAIWEFNNLGVNPGEAILNGTIVADVSGNGHDATVQGNGVGAVQAADGFDAFIDNFAARRTGTDWASRIATSGDASAFEFGPDEDFSIELFVHRAPGAAAENWGILAGTWHSRTLASEGAGLDPVADGAWYGYGLIADPNGGGWKFTFSPINEDRTFNPSFNELAGPPIPIPEGSHYMVVSVDRVTDEATTYLDGELIGSVFLPDGSALYTPTGFEPAHFAFLTGVDDIDRPQYRACPTGYSIDAARVMRRTIDPIEVFDNWLLISDGVAVPDIEVVDPVAIVVASSRDVLVDQCVSLSAANSSPPDGEAITTYEWKVGDGAFEAGGVMREVSFDQPSAGVVVTLRITASGGGTAEASVTIVVSQPAPVAQIAGSLAGTPLSGGTFYLRPGDILNLDGSNSSTPIPGGAVLCPIIDNFPLPAPAVTDYQWDIDGDGTTDETLVSFDLPPAGDPGESTISLTVVNDVGAEGTATVDLTVVDTPDVEPAPPGRIFLETKETLAIWEFNDLDLGKLGVIATGTVVPDVTGNGFDAVAEAADAGELEVVDGDRLDDNTAVNKVFDSQARLAVDDPVAFEMSETQDFSFELYVNRAAEVGGEGWGILAGTWHSRNLLDDIGDPVNDGAWYGYGLILDPNAGWHWNHSPISPDGFFTPSFNEIKTEPAFQIPAGFHYLVLTVDRTSERASAYVDGRLVAGANLPPGMAFIAPPDHDPMRMMFFTGEDDTTLGTYRGAPSGFSIDAARFMTRVLTPEEIAANHLNIRAGIAVPPTPRTGGGFVRGDSDQNQNINLTDGVHILRFLFVAGAATPGCLDASDADDMNPNNPNLTDGVFIFLYLFAMGPPPPLPSPSMAAGFTDADCGPDPTPDDGIDCLEPPDYCL